MKTKFITTVIALALTTQGFSAAEKSIDTEIDKVTVFFNGAQVYRSAYVNLSKGVNHLTFEGVSSRVNPKSIQLSGLGNYTIMDVKHGTKYPTANPATEQDPKVVRLTRGIHLLEDSIQTSLDNIVDIQFENEVFTTEKQLLLKSQVMSHQGNDTLPELQAALTFLRSQMMDIHTHLLRLKIEDRLTNEKLAGQRVRLQDLKNQRQSLLQGQMEIKGPVHYIQVAVVADQAVKGKMDLNYMVSNANWSPSYDLTAKDTDSPIELTYKAAIQQTTGVDWTDVNLTLSALDPNRNTRKPSLSRWGLTYIQRYNEVYSDKKLEYKAKERSLAPAMAESLDDELGYEADTFVWATDISANGATTATLASSFQTTIQNFSNTEYEVRLPYTIKTDGSAHHVVVKKATAEADFTHYAVPKLSSDAFLLARLSDWEELNLMAASANLYFGGTYVGETYINPNVMNDTLELSMGPDKDVYVERKRMKTNDKVRVIGTTKKVEANYLFKVRNNKNSKIHLVIEDQIPVALHEEITVELIEDGKGDLDEVDGIIRWEMNLKSGDSKEFEMGYTVEWKKEKDLNLPVL